jgi:hypothetical protein
MTGVRNNFVFHGHPVFLLTVLIIALSFLNRDAVFTAVFSFVHGFVSFF